MQRVGRGAGGLVKCLLDGEPAPDDAALPLREHGVLLGDSVFETLRAYDGVPFAVGEHIQRLERSAEWARLRVGASREILAADARRVAQSVEGDSAVRIFVMRGERAPNAPLASATSRRLVIAEPLALDEHDYVHGTSACVLSSAECGTPESPHAKYARYLPRLLARDDARSRGFNEALLTDDEGRIVSAATASVFVLLDGVLATSTILEGITRATVIQLARDIGCSHSIGPIEVRDLARATEMFITSSLRELVPIVRVDDQIIGTGAPGDTTRALHTALRKLAGSSRAPPWQKRS